MKLIKVLMLVLVLFSFVTPAFAALDDEMGTLVDRVMLIFKTLSVAFVAYAGICSINGNGMLIKPAIIGLILIFGADLIVDFFAEIFGN
jgi:hypothetical protein